MKLLKCHLCAKEWEIDDSKGDILLPWNARTCDECRERNRREGYFKHYGATLEPSYYGGFWANKED